MRRIYASMDIGSTTIKIIVAEIIKRKVNLLAVAETESKGIKDGLVINKDALTLVLKETVAKAEDIIGLKIKKIIVTVPTFHTEFLTSEGSTTITNPDKVIKGLDIVRAMQASVYNKIPDNFEIVDVVPICFKINDQEVIKNPLDRIAEKLYVKTLITMIPKENMLPILECFARIDIEVIGTNLSPIGDYYALKNACDIASALELEISSEVGAFINIGGSTTTVSIFNKGVLINTATIEMGGQNIDNDISFIYKVPKSDAKNIKETLGLAHKRQAQASSTMIVTNRLGESITINQYELSAIIMSRLEEILNLAKKQINYLTKKEIHYIIITGGVSETEDFSLTLESVFGKSAKLASLHEIGIRNNKYSAVLGILKNFDSKLRLRGKEYSIFSEEELEELSGKHRKYIADNSVLGKLFGYFFDN